VGVEGRTGLVCEGVALVRASEQVKRSTGDAASLCCTASKEGHESAMIAQSRLLCFTSLARRKMGDIREI
jgi:hypothetical protein